MTPTSIGDLLPTIFPLVLTLLMGFIGLARGIRREAVVSAAIVLGALIVEQWAAPWADDLYALFTGVGRNWQQLVLSYALLILVVLVLGYGLGKFVHTLPVGRSGRTWGLLLGLLNGAALSGWLLRYIYTNLDGAQAASPLYQNSASYGFMIWAGWFPVALAVIGAVVALLTPVRRVQAVVSQPSVGTDWTPAPVAAPIASTTTAVTSTRYSEPAGPVASSLAPTQPYNAQSFGASVPSYAPAPPPPTPSPILSSNAYRAEPLPEHDAPSTQLLPVSEASLAPRSVGAVDPQGSETRNFVPPISNVPQDGSARAGAASSEQAATAEWTPGATPSWLMGGSTPVPATEVISTPSSALSDAGVGSSTQAGLPANEVDKPTPITGPLHEEALSGKACQTCGATLPPNARFCTECGTPVTQA